MTIKSAASFLIWGQFLYILGFNWIPGGARLYFAGILTAVHLYLAIRAILTYTSNFNLLAAACVLLTVLCWVISSCLFYSFNVQSATRDIMAFLAVIWIMTFPDQIPMRSVQVLASLTIILAFGFALVMPKFDYAGTMRFATFTGGQEAIHTTSFAVLACMVIIDQMRYYRMVAPMISWFLLGLGTFLLAGYKVSTSQIACTVYIFGMVVSTFQTNSAVMKLMTVVAICVTSLIAITWLIYVDSTGGNYGELGSGRIDSYETRIKIFLERPFDQQLVGTGPGSDAFYTEFWWWEKKDSHNDFLKVLIERGLIGLVVMLVFLIATYQALPSIARPILLAITASSTISNGLIGRPAVVILMLAAFAIPVSRPQIIRPWIMMPQRQGTRSVSALPDAGDAVAGQSRPPSRP